MHAETWSDVWQSICYKSYCHWGVMGGGVLLVGRLSSPERDLAIDLWTPPDTQLSPVATRSWSTCSMPRLTVLADGLKLVEGSQWVSITQWAGGICLSQHVKTGSGGLGGGDQQVGPTAEKAVLAGIVEHLEQDETRRKSWSSTVAGEVSIHNGFWCHRIKISSAKRVGLPLCNSSTI